MISLKSYCKPLSRILGMTPDALYERQRSLTRTEYFSGTVEGKGPGSGVRATPTNVAKLLLSVLSTDALSEVQIKTAKLAASKSVIAKCPLTGQVRFLRAMESILSNGDLAERAQSIEVYRIDLNASISLKTGNDRMVSRFGNSERKAPGINLEIIARLPGWGAELICADLRKISEGEMLPSDWHS